MRPLNVVLAQASPSFYCTLERGQFRAMTGRGREQ